MPTCPHCGYVGATPIDIDWVCNRCKNSFPTRAWKCRVERCWDSPANAYCDLHEKGRTAPPDPQYGRFALGLEPILPPVDPEKEKAAKEELTRLIAIRDALDSEFASHHLERPDQLPDLLDDPLILVWDVDYGGTESPKYTVVKHVGREIWRERAFYECVGRFDEVVAVLQQKYGKALRGVLHTSRSRCYLLGDDLRATQKLEDINKRMAPDSITERQRLDAVAAAGDPER